MSGRHKTGIAREQAMLLPPSVEDYVAADNPVRVIDAYVEGLDLARLGFRHVAGTLGAGQPPYDPRQLLKLYLYGYLMRVRTSRLLEREARRNLELIWLLQGLAPNYKSIADFRKDNAAALKATNCDFVLMCKELDLYAGQLIAIDGSFFRGNVAKHSIYTKERLAKALARVEQHIDDYLKALDQADAQVSADSVSPADIKATLEALKERQKKLRDKLTSLDETGQTQYAEVDSDARLLSKSGQSVAGYNVQIAVDDKHKLLVCCELTQDGNDTQQLEPMASKAKEVLGVDQLTVVADAGYYNQIQLKACEEAGMTVYVPASENKGPVDTEKRYGRDQFSFDSERNAYCCPQGQWLSPCGSQQQGDKRVLRYASARSVCATCAVRERCLSAKTARREIYRWEHEAIMDTHRSRMQKEGAMRMRQRACLVEHPFGTLKRWCGWLHFLVRGKAKASGELGLLMLCYNFRRLMTIFGIAGMSQMLKMRASTVMAA